jgi:hypothetical protein
MKPMKSFLMFSGFLALVLSLTGPATASQTHKYDSLLGVWDVETEGAQYTFVFSFYLDEGELAGKFEGQSGEVAMQNLKFEDQRVSFTVEVDAGGQAMLIDFEATISGDNLEGMLSLEFGEAGIIGTRRK